MTAYILLAIAFYMALFALVFLPELEIALEEDDDLARRQPEGAE